MLALKVEVDGQPFIVAGSNDWAVLSAQITAINGDPKETDALLRADHIALKVGAVSHPESDSMPHHSRWGNLDLGLGSRVTITIVDTHEPEPPVKRYQLPPKSVDNKPADEEKHDALLDNFLASLKKIRGEHE